MGRTKARVLPARVESVRERIEYWRETREKRSAMPERLWDAAVSVARAHGLWAVSRALRVNYETLKSRVDRAAKGGAAGRRARFVELDGPELIGPAGRAGTVVELSRADGARLVVRLEGCEAPDVLALADGFWRCGT